MTQPVRTLRRLPQDKKVAGVCAGLARYAGVDPVLVRLAFVLLTIVGGSGLLLYGVAWVIVPKAEAGQALAPAAAPAPRSTILGIIGVVIGAAVVFGDWSFGPRNGLLPLLLVGGGVALLLHRDDASAVDRAAAAPSMAPPRWDVPDGMVGRQDGDAPAGAAGPPGAPAFGVTSTVPDGIGQPEVPAWASDWYRAQTEARAELGLPPLPPPGFEEPTGPAAPVATRPRKRLRRVVAVFVVGLFVLFAAAVAGVGAMVSGGIGERTYRPTSWDSLQSRYELGVGELVLDLTGLPALEASRAVSVDVGMGHAMVIVPAGVTLQLDGHAGMGEVVPPSGEADAQDGVDATLTTRIEGEPSPPGADGADGADDATGAGGPVLHLEAEVGMGQVEVIRR